MSRTSTRACGLIVKRVPCGVSWKPWPRSISRQDGSGADAILVLELADLRLALLVEGVGLADRFVDLDVDLAEMDDVGLVVGFVVNVVVEVGEA